MLAVLRLSVPSFTVETALLISSVTQPQVMKAFKIAGRVGKLWEPPPTSHRGFFLPFFVLFALLFVCACAFCFNTKPKLEEGVSLLLLWISPLLHVSFSLLSCFCLHTLPLPPPSIFCVDAFRLGAKQLYCTIDARACAHANCYNFNVRLSPVSPEYLVK